MKIINKTYNSMKIVILLILISTIVFNCSKDDNINAEPQQLNYRVANYATDLGTFNITYNQNNFIESIQTPNRPTDQVTYDSNDRITAIGAIRYHYNGADEIIEIISENTDATLEYNELGKIIRINTFRVNDDNSTSESIASFVYDSNGVVDYVIESNSDTPALTYITRYTYDANLNIAQIFEEETMDDINYNLTRTQTFTYDDKKAPYYQINTILNNDSKFSVFNFWNFYDYPLTRKSFQSVWHYSPNNYVTLNKVTSTGATTVFNFENSYNDQGYLTSANRTVTSPTGTETYAIFSFNYELY